MKMPQLSNSQIGLLQKMKREGRVDGFFMPSLTERLCEGLFAMGLAEKRSVVVEGLPDAEAYFMTPYGEQALASIADRQKRRHVWIQDRTMDDDGGEDDDGDEDDDGGEDFEYCETCGATRGFDARGRRYYKSRTGCALWGSPRCVTFQKERN